MLKTQLQAKMQELYLTQVQFDKLKKTASASRTKNFMELDDLKKESKPEIYTKADELLKKRYNALVRILSFVVSFS